MPMKAVRGAAHDRSHILAPHLHDSTTTGHANLRKSCALVSGQQHPLKRLVRCRDIPLSLGASRVKLELQSRVQRKSKISTRSRVTAFHSPQYLSLTPPPCMFMRTCSASPCPNRVHNRVVRIAAFGRLDTAVQHSKISPLCMKFRLLFFEAGS